MRHSNQETTAYLKSLSWPGERLGEALQALARQAGFQAFPAEALQPPAAALKGPGRDGLSAWMERAATRLGVEAEPVETPYPDVEAFLKVCGPALVSFEDSGERSFLLVIRNRGRRGGRLRVLSPELRTCRVRVSDVVQALRWPLEAPLIPEANQVLDASGIHGRRRDAARAAILNAQLGTTPVQNCWLLRVPSGSDAKKQVVDARLIPQVCVFIAAHILESILVVVAWWMIGRAVLQGRIGVEWMIPWALTLATIVPLRLMATWAQGVLAIGAGALLKRHLLAGAMRLPPEEIRSQGVGQLLGRVIESEALESLALSGGLIGLVSVIEAVIAAVVLSVGAGRVLLGLLLLVWLCGILCLALRYIPRRRRWTASRLAITHNLIERMTGHRTRLAQEAPENWNVSEDVALTEYLEASGKMDAALVRFTAIAPKGWLIVSILTLTRDFQSGDASSGALAVTFGGILLAYGALKKFTTSLAYMAGAAIAWQQVKPLWDAARRQEPTGAVELDALQHRDKPAVPFGSVLIEGRDIVFRHQERANAVLAGSAMTIREGDRILLEGPSGGGKSTLASILAGLREPESGLVTFSGMDRQTIGAKAWRRMVAAAPQFHENHILAETMAFNLLMGRDWPPQPEDMREAEEVCRELGLGPLLERMPAGLLQQIGETGWQLSYGERSRLFVARALLQRASFVILDESFGCLDPESLRQAMNCVRSRARTLLVIAHP